ncbi:Nramp family divalent metal transporter [Corynebacterium sanguinis]|uniref:Nramp family divalent metal transporter n=1 Tax=Corynebacterium sanguinis TaxID=2594913 RepID=UPI0021B00960|nr:Nramp family divalent metal transporter [Corynebacterium sanguinis]MCT1425138.1 Nramp family divalent metal transporter [Corynebacterium sanguinis]MCT1554743.1 Nramp family divalent metal transporter [Corynebacterium sanguinis]MCT1614557.1 Nramp family divalent metal transporter [Corynebacterium sanguinis]MCT1629373.1 Nramp family divalent metal transporter [Corynebacterium sanguinis]MCT1663718.1 Nramp family divalent metal transporter [Corynebacterium sanguinis]
MSTVEITPAPKRKSGLFGPGLLIAASFIGPGTVTTATVTGANFGYALVWAIVFSIVATIILQEMSVRLGLAARLSTGEALRQTFNSQIIKSLMIILVVSAIGIGGAAYAGGDTTGTALALASVTSLPHVALSVGVAAVVLILLLSGSYAFLEKVMTVLVAILALTFVITAISVRPDLGAMLRSTFIPTVPDGALLSAVALIGTTVVPYNVFLHSNLVQEKWGDEPRDPALKKARVDNVVSISLGGLITLAIVATAAAVMFAQGLEATSAADLAAPLRPMLGDAAPWLLAIGLFAAGLTSAVAGPMGAAYAICGVMGWPTDMKSQRFRIIVVVVVLFGAAIAISGFNPIQIIILAQAANGILLPVITFFLLLTMNNKRLLGEHANSIVGNILGGLIFLVTLVLGGLSLVDLF